MAEIAQLYNTDKAAYEEKAREYTMFYAGDHVFDDEADMTE